LARKKSNAEAITEFDSAIKLDPKNVNAYVSRAITYSEQGQYQKAIDDFTKVLGSDGQKTFEEFWIGDKAAQAYVYYNRGIAYYKFGKYQESINDCNTAINLQSKLAVAYQVRADAYQHQGMLDLAQSDRDTAKKLGYKPKADGESTF
jgi:tetratricopeptide (TPR) repeat protein